MNNSTITQSLSSEAITNKILNSKGQFVKAAWKSNPKPAGAFKNHVLEKKTVAVVQAGVNFANLSAVKVGIEEGTRGDVKSLPWGEWKVVEGVSLFPYIITHRGCDYLRLYPSQGNNHKGVTTFYVDDVKVSKEVFATYLTPSESKKLLTPSDADRPLCFTIKAENVLGLPEDVIE